MVAWNSDVEAADVLMACMHPYILEMYMFLSITMVDPDVVPPSAYKK